MAKLSASLDLCFSALADPTRRAILTRLARGEASASELAAPHDMALPSFMAHLAKLEAAGLVASTKRGRSRIYTLSPGAFLPATDWLDAQKGLWAGRLDDFDDYVMSLAKEKDHDD